jgi:hypothetical protein
MNSLEWLSEIVGPDMPVETRYVVFEGSGLVYIQRAGEFALGDFAAFMAGFVDEPDFKPGRNYLVDQRRVTYPVVRYAEVSSLSAVWADIYPRLGKCKFAFVHEADGHFGTGRMSAMIFENDDVDRRPFCETSAALRCAALRWLGVPEDFELPDLF